MTEKTEVAAPKEPTKKKKAKRGTSSRKDMSASARSSGFRQGDGDDNEKRRRSRSTDKVKTRRDSGSRRMGEKERNNNGEGAPQEEWERKGRSSTKDGSMRGSGRQQYANKSSPPRVRRATSDGVKNEKGPGPNKDRSRSRSPSRSSSTAAGLAPKLPQRTVSESSSLQSALEANKNKHNSKEPITKKDSFEEASMGDFQLYAQQQQQKHRVGGPSLKIRSSGNKMVDIPEESLGSFAAFAKNYEQEKLLGLHDNDDGPDVYGQNSAKPPPLSQPQQDQQNDDVSMSFGNLASPMNAGGPKAQTNKPPVEESLGSFTAFHHQYEQEKLLGLHDSTMSALQSAAPPAKERKPSIPEESMGDFAQVAAKEDNEKSNNSSGLSSRSKTRGEEKEKESQEVILPKNRIEKLGKRGGVGYRIMVDTPGGHSPQPMKIVVAIEFEDETDSDESDDEEEEDPLESYEAQKAKEQTKVVENEPAADQADELLESGHLPLSALEDDCLKEKPQHKKKKHQRKGSTASGKDLTDLLTHQTAEGDEEDEDDEIGPLDANMSRWNRPIETRASSPKQPEREKSTHSHSTSSTVSSVTLDTVLQAGLQITADASPSHPTPQRKPGGIRKGMISNAGLRRPSGVVQPGGTATLLRRPSIAPAPHNLGTKRGLMLRQQSEASMMSTATSKSNDSSWVSPNNDVPEDYQASFMQLNLLNLGETEMQTNEEVEQAELPDELLSGVENLDGKKETQQHAQLESEELGAIPEGKDPKAAATELLGMKTMLKHIKRVAPKRSKSFDFDRDMPKQMWNKMFAKAQKGELPGSRYVDNDDSTGHEEDDKIQSTRSAVDAVGGSTRATDEAVEHGDERSKSMTAAMFSTIKKVTGTGPSTSAKPIDSSGSKGKSSLWSSTIKSVMPSTKKANADEVAPEQTEKTNDEGSEGSLELDGILQELDKSLALHHDASGYGDDDPVSASRRDHHEKGNDGSARGGRSSRSGGDGPRKGGTARSRAARARDVHNRSLRDTVDFYNAEQEDDDLPQLDAVNEEEAKRKPRARARKKVPNRTKSDDGTARVPRMKSADGGTRAVHRTRSQDGSPTRPSREATKKMHQSFTGVDPSDAPPIRRLGTKTRESASGQQDPIDAPPLRRQGTKSREGSGQQGKDAPHRTRSHDKGMRGSAGRKQRPQRKRSNVGIDDNETPALKRGANLEGATEEELREILDYH